MSYRTSKKNPETANLCTASVYTLCHAKCIRKQCTSQTWIGCILLASLELFVWAK